MTRRTEELPDEPRPDTASNGRVGIAAASETQTRLRRSKVRRTESRRSETRQTETRRTEASRADARRSVRRGTARHSTALVADVPPVDGALAEAARAASADDAGTIATERAIAQTERTGAEAERTDAGAAVAGETPAEPIGSPRTAVLASWRARLEAHLRLVAPALIGYAALRIVCMVVVWIWASHMHTDFAQVFARWDMKAYADIARNGYDHAITYKLDGVPQTNNLAYFPLYPLMIRGLVAVLPISYVGAGLAIDWIASLAAVWGMFMLGRHLYGRRVGIALGIVWAVVPYAFDESINLTESLFTALAVWCLYALLTRRWLTAGVLCLIAGFSRPTAIALIAAVGVAAVVSLVRREQPWWRPVLAVLISPLAWLGYLAWVGQRLHRADAWFYVERFTFRSSFDGGRYTLHMLGKTLAHKQQSVEPYVVTLILLAAVVLLVLSIVQRQPLPLLVYSALLFITTAGGTNYFHTNPRHLLPAVPLLLPVARALGRMRLSNAVAVVGVMGVVAAWYGGYLALIWGSSY